MLVQATAAVAAPAEAVWAALVDVERWPTWTRSMRRVTRLEDGPLELGSRVRIRQPRVAAVVWELTGLEPGRSLTWTIDSPGMRTEARREVRPMGAGTSEVRIALEQTGALAGIVGRAYVRMTRRYVRMEAEGIAQLLRNHED